MKKKLWFLILTVIVGGCSKDELNPYTNEDLANDEFYPYLELFLEEANKRGYDFGTHYLNFYFADIDYAVGLSQGRNKILIDRKYWNTATPERKEWLIFHELGHSILNRKHRNERSDSGECFSFMKGSENDFECSMNLYSSLWRNYFLDELFDETTPLPEWYENYQNYEKSYSNTKDIIIESNISIFHTQIDLDTISNFVLEIQFNRLQSNTDSSIGFTSSIQFNGYYFNGYQGTPLKFLKINRDTNNMFENLNYNFEDNVKLTIRKNENLFQFFIDEQFLHAMEIVSFDNTNLTIVVNNEVYQDLEYDLLMFEFD